MDLKIDDLLLGAEEAEEGTEPIFGQWSSVLAFAGEIWEMVTGNTSEISELKADIATLKAQIAGAGAANDNTPSAEEEHQSPPTIIILGNNHAEIALNTTYSDLGATAQDAQGNDFSITLLLNEEFVEQIDIDTATVGTHTITYQTQDSTGTSIESTRTVIVGGEVVEEIAGEVVVEEEVLEEIVPADTQQEPQPENTDEVPEDQSPEEIEAPELFGESEVVQEDATTTEIQEVDSVADTNDEPELGDGDANIQADVADNQSPQSLEAGEAPVEESATVEVDNPTDSDPQLNEPDDELSLSDQEPEKVAPDEVMSNAID